MSTFILILAMVVVSIILIQLTGSVLGDLDYKRQVSGLKKPRCTDHEEPYSETTKPSPEIDALREAMLMKGMQNLLGPK